jgi:hypothetical protein
MTTQKIKEILLPFLEKRENIQLYNIKQLVLLYEHLYNLKLDSKIKNRVNEFLELLTTKIVEKDGIQVNSSMLKYFIDSCLEEINKKLTITEVQKIKYQIHPFTREKIPFNDVLAYNITIN